MNDDWTPQPRLMHGPDGDIAFGPHWIPCDTSEVAPKPRFLSTAWREQLLAGFNGLHQSSTSYRNADGGTTETEQ